MDDTELLAYLKDTQLPVEVSPWSNYCLGVAEKGKPHPIRQMVDAGVYCTVNSDDPARFMQLCDAFGLPILSLCDAPGFMVGPDCERTAMVRHASRMFVVGANLRVPILTIVLRKGYGLGAMAMAGGSFHESLFIVSWPTGEFGGMGLEGAVKLGFRKELEAVEDEQQRAALYDKLVKQAYEQGKGINTASVLEIDEVIDPKDSRLWVVTALKNMGKMGLENEGRGYVDCW